MARIVRALMAMIMVLALAGVAGLGTIAVMRARSDAQSRVATAATDRARAIAQVVHDAVQDEIGALIATTKQRVLYLAVPHKDYRGAEPYLSELIRSHPRIASVGIYNGAGQLVVRIPGDPSIAGRRFGQQEYFKAARNVGAAHISKLFVQLGKPKVPVIAYSLSVHHPGAYYGVLVATTPIREFDALVAPYAPAGSTVRIYNAAGERISPSSEASGKTYTTDAVVGPALAGRSSIRRTGGSIVAAEPVADFGWAIVVSQPARRGDKAVHDLTVRLSLLAGGATLLALIAAAAAWRRKPRHAD